MSSDFATGYDRGRDNENYLWRRQLEKLRNDLWMEGVNLTGEYQGVWVRYRDIERLFDKYLGKENKDGSN